MSYLNFDAWLEVINCNDKLIMEIDDVIVYYVSVIAFCPMQSTEEGINYG